MIEPPMIEPKGPKQRNDDEQEGSVLARWSRRKQHAQSQPTPLDEHSSDLPSAPPDIQQAEQAQIEPQALQSTEHELGDSATNEEPLLTDDDMPAIESLDSSSNISCFFNAGVSEKLRQAALRHLLRLPAFNITDGLNDYDEDYTSFEPLGDIVTSDMRFHTARKEKLAEQQRLEEEQLAAAAEEDENNQAPAEEIEQSTDAQDATTQEPDEEEAAASNTSGADPSVSDDLEAEATANDAALATDIAEGQIDHVVERDANIKTDASANAAHALNTIEPNDQSAAEHTTHHVKHQRKDTL